MTHLGIARTENGKVHMPDAFRRVSGPPAYEAVEIGGDILLTRPPLDRERLARVERLADAAIVEHRKALEGLAR